MTQGVTGNLHHVAAKLRRRIYPLDLLVRAIQAFLQDGGTIYAAAISYYVLFSLFPTMIFLVTVFGFVVQDPAIRQQVIDRVVAEIPMGTGVRAEVEGVIDGVAESSQGWISLVGLAGTAWSASAIFAALRRVLNQAFGVPNARSFVRGRILDILNLFGLGFLVLASVAITASFQIVRRLTAEVVDGFLVTLMWNLITLVLPLLISFTIFMLLYRILPNYQASYRDIWVGAMIAAIGFELAKVGFTIYVANFGNYQEVYGALGGVVAFLFFVFLVANIIIFAAEVISELSKDRIAREHQARPLRGRGQMVIDRTATGS